MFSSLRSKMFFILTLIMLVTATVIMFFTDRDVGSAMREAGRASAKNILHLVELNIQEAFYKMQADKLDAITSRRQQLRDIAQVSELAIGKFDGLVQYGNLTEERFREAIIDWFDSASFARGVDSFVFDTDGTILAHSKKAAVGSSLAQLRDIKTRSVARVMRADVLKARGDFAVFHWDTPWDPQRGKKMGFFLPLPRAGWTIGAVVSIADIEADAQRKQEKIIEGLAESFAQVNIAQTGCALVYDGAGSLLVPPCGGRGEDGGTESIEAPAAATITQAAQSEGGALQVAGDGGSGDIQIYAEYFKPLDWFIAVYLPVQEITLPARELITRQIAVIAAIFAGSLLLSFLFVSRISRPLNLLASHAKTIAGYDFAESDAQAEAEVPLPVRRNDEVGRLAEAFDFMRTELRKNVRELMETTAAKERIVSELSVAHTIQMGILPKTFPAFPQCAAFDLYAVLEPAKSVGGDLYDFYFIDDHHLCFTIGDVSDKGVPAALFMVITRTLIKTLAAPGMDPAEVMARVNDTISVDNPNAMFVTLIIGVLDIRDGRIRYANGGHNPPIVLTTGQPAAYRPGLSGPAVGAMEDLPYSGLELTLAPGDALFLYTDGVTEAMDRDHTLFSDERLLQEVEQRSAQSADTVVTGVMQAVTTHAASAGYQSDDITMLMLRYNGPGSTNPDELG